MDNRRALGHAIAAAQPAVDPLGDPDAPLHPLAELTERDWADFSMESDAARAELRLWQRVFTRILEAPHGTRAAVIQREADALAACAMPGREITAKALGKRYEKFHAAAKGKARYWYRTMIDRRRNKAPGAFRLPAALQRWIRQRYADHPRHGAARRIHEEMLARWVRWRAGDDTAKLPGYRVPPAPCRFNSGLPEGWSIDTVRRLRPDAGVLSIVHVGPKAGSIMGPMVYHTRCTPDGRRLPFKSLYYFDDAWHDHECHFIGFSKRPVRPVSFYAMEGLTTYRDCVIAPRFYDEEADKHRNLNETDFFWFLVRILTEWGYNAESGTLLVMEHGTANARIDSALREATGGKVRIARSETYGSPAVQSLLFQCEGGGNFRFKAPLEGIFQLDHNRRAHLPAYLGASPKSKPEEHLGLCRYHDELAAWVDKMPPDLFARLRLPKLHIADYARAAYGLNDAINRRTRHEIEGWERAGFVDFRWRLDLASDQWGTRESWEALPEATRDAMAPLMRQPGYSEMPRLSPRGAWLRECRELEEAKAVRYLTDAQLAAIAPAKLWRAVKIGSNGEIAISSAENITGADKIRFRSIAENPSGDSILLQRGAEYRALFNPFRPDRLLVARPDGSYIGRVWNVNPSIVTDADGLAEQMRDVSQARGAIAQSVAEVTQRKAAERAQDREHNDSIIRQAERRAADEQAAADAALRRAMQAGVREPIDPDADADGLTE